MSEITAVEGYTEAELASLSPEERASIGVDIPEEKLPSRIVDDANAGEAAREMQQQAKEQAAAKAVSDAAVVAAAKASAEGKPKVADPAAASKVEPAVVDAVVKVADAPAVAAPDPFVPKFQAKLIPDNEFEAAQAALAKQFEDGDITMAAFVAQNNTLNRQKIEGDMAMKQTEQNADQLWQFQQDTWFSQAGNAVVRDDPRVWAAMQAQLETMYGDPAKKSYTNLQFLDEAGTEVKRLFGLDVAQGKAKVDTPEPKKAAVATAELPATLAAVPAAAENIETTEFEYLDKMDGMDYEIAVAKMNPEQKARFLAA